MRHDQARVRALFFAEARGAVELCKKCKRSVGRNVFSAQSFACIQLLYLGLCM